MSSENIYLRCRKESAKSNDRLRSRESTAEMLGCSVSQLANYELGVTKVVPPDAVVMMADLYNAPELKAHYCSQECPIGKDAPIATEIKSIELVTVRLMKALTPSTVEDAKNKLIDIAADGIISEDEKPVLSELLQFLDSLTHVLSELRLVGQKYLAEGGDYDESG